MYILFVPSSSLLSLPSPFRYPRHNSASSARSVLSSGAIRLSLSLEQHTVHKHCMLQLAI